MKQKLRRDEVQQHVDELHILHHELLSLQDKDKTADWLVYAATEGAGYDKSMVPVCVASCSHKMVVAYNVGIGQDSRQDCQSSMASERMGLECEDLCHGELHV